ncbi:MAG: chromate transporter [Clostridiales bacterium]|nr:chromate transporter [Clostridiales bacterium]
METNTNLSKQKILVTLFLSTLYISAFTFGGGFVIITFMKRKFVDKLHWIDETEMLDLTAIAQSSPGAIAVNASILVGYRILGIPGIITATLGTVLPPMLILSIISFFYHAFSNNLYIALLLKGMQAGIAAVIFDVVFELGFHVIKEHSWLKTLIMLLSFFAVVVLQVNVIIIILVAAFIGVMKELVTIKRRKKQ